MDGKLPDRDDIGQSKISKRKKMLEVQLWILESYVVSGKGTSNDNEQPKLKHVGEPGAGPTTVVCLPPSPCREVTLLRADLEAAPTQLQDHHASFLKELMPNDTKRKNCSSFELLIQSCYYRVKNGVKEYCN
ncbi:hypothetical protein TRIUR3_06697 [Triticum urartu]|uniref:Uncharacterized protein n=1 Tax=Triticum urartu TaxID=4572 RepID=M7ZQL3_TRIUA|nr:hypothetical protein TRIUR3_06697 [Triticum urartu]